MGASGFDVDTHSEPAFSLEQKKSISGTGFGAASNRSHEPPRPRDRHSLLSWVKKTKRVAESLRVAKKPFLIFTSIETQL
jgi:hypothetical protein